MDQNTRDQIAGQKVYGSMFEEGESYLDDKYSTDECPKCGKATAHYYRLERVEGGCINFYSGYDCTSCGASEGDRGGDDW